jgi:hypothetical protein
MKEFLSYTQMSWLRLKNRRLINREAQDFRRERILWDAFQYWIDSGKVALGESWQRKNS